MGKIEKRMKMFKYNIDVIGRDLVGIGVGLGRFSEVVRSPFNTNNDNGHVLSCENEKYIGI